VTVTIVSPGDSVPVVGVADNHGVVKSICHETVAVVPFWSMIGRLPVCAEKLSEVAEIEIWPCGGSGSPGPDGDELFEHDRTTQTTTPSTKLGRGLATNLRSLNAPPIIVDVNSRTLYASLGLTLLCTRVPRANGNRLPTVGKRIPLGRRTATTPALSPECGLRADLGNLPGAV
jgi:hypothetical protein